MEHNDSRIYKRIRTLELLIRDNEETVRQRLEDGTILKPDETNRLSRRVDKYIEYQNNIRILTDLLNKAKTKAEL